MACNVCVCAVVGFRSRHCPRGQTLNEDNTLNLHVTPPLRKHFVGGSLYIRLSNFILHSPNLNLLTLLMFLLVELE
jgi:hypothetical protein